MSPTRTYPELLKIGSGLLILSALVFALAIIGGQFLAGLLWTILVAIPLAIAGGAVLARRWLKISKHTGRRL